MNRTTVTLELSEAAFAEIADKLLKAGHQNAFHTERLIDMHGIAVARERPAADPRQGSLLDCPVTAMEFMKS